MQVCLLREISIKVLSLDETFARLLVVSDDPREVVESASIVSPSRSRRIDPSGCSLFLIHLPLPLIFKALLALNPRQGPFFRLDPLDRQLEFASHRPMI